MSHTVLERSTFDGDLLSMSIFKVVLVGTAGAGKKTLAHALLRHMGEDGPAGDDEETGVLGQPKQAALINNQKCLVQCDDVFPDEDEGDVSETGALLPKDTGRGGRKPALKRGGGGPKLRKKENIFDKAAKAKGLAKAKMVKSEGPLGAGPQEEQDQYPTGYIVVFDIGELPSFKEAERQLDKLCAPDAGQQNFVVLAGNKTDKSRRYRKVTYEEGLKLSQKYPDIDYIETSAKLYQKVDKVFLTVVKKVQNSIATPEVNPIGESGGKATGKKGGGGGSAGGAGLEDGETEDLHAGIDDGAADEGTGNVCYDNFCCKCCPKPFRRCGKKCGKSCCPKSCTIM